MDSEARGDTVARNAGKLREPALMFASVLRGLNGKTDGAALSYWWGDTLSEHVFMPPSVFNFYPPDYPVPGTTLLGPEFSIHGANSALNRLNFLTYLMDWGGSTADTTIPNATGTAVDLSGFTASAADPATLVDRISNLALGQPLPSGARDQVIAAVSVFTTQNDATHWQLDRVKAAAYLIYASPNFQIQR